MGHSYSNLLVHIVFSTKDRAKDLTAEIRSELYSFLAGLLTEKRCLPIRIGGGLDHLHALLAIPASVSVSELVGFVKSNSSRWLSRRFGCSFSWQEGYAAFSVSHSNRKDVAGYITGQVEHHKRISFEDEFVSLLKKNEIEFENEHLWG